MSVNKITSILLYKKIYFDKIRSAPIGWILVKQSEKAIGYLKTGNIEEISLNHDFGYDTREAGYDVIKWIELKVTLNNFGNEPKTGKNLLNRKPNAAKLYAN